MKHLVCLTVIIFATVGCSTDIESSQTDFSFGSFVDIVCSTVQSRQIRYDRYYEDLPEENRSAME